ncbi:MAG: threonine-phosphate decarboxylase [Acidobacteriota bacterium]|nr:threonine-phosphate decarboxylase [Acidobacteriota bacterium]
MNLREHGDTLAREGMLDFAVNVWPAPRPAALERALAEALADSGRYPSEQPARQAIAARHGRSVEEVLLLNGACEAFWLLAHTYRPKVSVCIHPSFTEPEAALRAAGGEVVRVQREPEQWIFRPVDVPEEAQLVVVGHPNNPTGNLDAAEAITALGRRWRLLVVDESFIDFVPHSEASLAGRAEVPGLAVIRSLTKLWALPGIRAGYLLAPAEIVERLAAHRQPWSVNTLACAALTTCASDRDTPRRVAAQVASAREELAEALQLLPGLRVWPSQANFLLLRVPDDAGLVEALRERRIAVRPAASFPGLDERYIRVAVRTRADNRLLVNALTEILA